jgi:hypothetical protein
MRRALHLTKRSKAIIVGSAVASWVVWQVLPRAADPRFQDIGRVFDGAEVHFLRGDVTQLACATATFARAEQIRPTDPELPVRYAPASLRQGIVTLARLRVACGAPVSVPTAHRIVDTTAVIVAVVGGAQVTIIAIQFFADARVPVKRLIAGTRFIVAICRALVAVIHAIGTKVLSAQPLDADLT